MFICFWCFPKAWWLTTLWQMQIECDMEYQNKQDCLLPIYGLRFTNTKSLCDTVEVRRSGMMHLQINLSSHSPWIRIQYTVYASTITLPQALLRGVDIVNLAGSTMT